jgi:hypothetical protein
VKELFKVPLSFSPSSYHAPLYLEFFLLSILPSLLSLPRYFILIFNYQNSVGPTTSFLLTKVISLLTHFPYLTFLPSLLYLATFLLKLFFKFQTFTLILTSFQGLFSYPASYFILFFNYQRSVSPLTFFGPYLFPPYLITSPYLSFINPKQTTRPIVLTILGKKIHNFF